MNAEEQRTKSLADLAAEQAAWEAKETYKGYVVAELRTTFGALHDPRDWRAPIRTWIMPERLDRAKVAVEFFTATELMVVGEPHPVSGCLQVYSIGYRQGPAGDH